MTVSRLRKIREATAAVGGRLALAVPVALLTMLCLAATALGAGRVYWANNTANTISYADLDGSGGGDLDTGAATVESPSGVVIDPAAGRIYWANTSSGISYANLDGTGGGDLDTGAARTEFTIGLGIDPAGGRVYWPNVFASKISYGDLDGSGGGDLDTGGVAVEGPVGMAVDPAAGRVYWGSLLGGIFYASLDGTGGGRLDTGTVTAQPTAGLAIDPVTERIFWANLGEEKISYANLDGSGGGDVLAPTVPSEVVGLAVDPAAGRIYWGGAGDEMLGYADLDGTGDGEIDTAGASAGVRAFPALLKPPTPTAPPAIDGGATVGATLTCTAAWGPDLPQAFLFRAPQSVRYDWSLDGAPIAGAAGTSIHAAGPGEYRCTVSATNAAGVTTRTSAAHLVSVPAALSTAAPTEIAPAPAVPLPPARATARGRAMVRGGRAFLGLRCPGPGSCQGTLKLLDPRLVQGGGGRDAGSGVGAPARSTRRVGATFALAAGEFATVPVRLSKGVMVRLRKAGRRGLKAQLLGSGVGHRTVRLALGHQPRAPRSR